jgi:hypothetical protein
MISVHSDAMVSRNLTHCRDPYQDVPENPLARDFDGPSFLTGKGTWEQALPPLPPSMVYRVCCFPYSYARPYDIVLSQRKNDRTLCHRSQGQGGFRGTQRHEQEQ